MTKTEVVLKKMNDLAIEKNKARLRLLELKNELSALNQQRLGGDDEQRSIVARLQACNQQLDAVAKQYKELLNSKREEIKSCEEELSRVRAEYRDWISGAKNHNGQLTIKRQEYTAQIAILESFKLQEEALEDEMRIASRATDEERRKADEEEEQKAQEKLKRLQDEENKFFRTPPKPVAGDYDPFAHEELSSKRAKKR